MGVCVNPFSICPDKSTAINVNRSIGVGGNLSSSVNNQKEKKNNKSKLSIERYWL